MNILIGKFGRSIFFDKKSWSIYAGDDEAPILYTELAKRYPQHTFYLIGKSDIYKIKRRLKKAEVKEFSLFGDDTPAETLEDYVPSNIIDLFEGFNNSGFEFEHDYLWDLIEKENLKFDAGIMIVGPMPQIGIPNKGIQRLDGEPGIALEMFQKYYAPPMHVLNMSGTPHFTIVTDPRYVPYRTRDIYNDEHFVLSQINTEFHGRKRISGYFEKSAPQNLRTVSQKYEYGAVETIFMMHLDRVDFREMKKEKQFIMAVNSAGPQSDRQKIIKEWLLLPKISADKQIKIYGKWEPEFIEQFPGVFEEKAIRDIEDEFWNSRYTFIPPWSLNQSNFVTQKFWKMIYYGIIPFFHPKYDTDKLFPVPDFLRVNSPQQMWERIDHLENNEQDYRRLLKILYKILDDKYFSGEFMMNKMSESVQRITGKTL